MIQNSIDIAVLAWGMVQFGKISTSPGEPAYPWIETDSLENAIRNFLPLAGVVTNTTGQGQTIARQGQAAQQQGQAPPAPTGTTNPATIAAIAETSQEEPDRDLELVGFFTLCDMDRLAGFAIRWTDNLLSHLLARRLREPGFTTTVFVFHHATILRHLKTG